MSWRADAAPPSASNLKLLRQFERIVDLYAKVSDSALQLSMTQEKLAGSQAASLLIDQRDLGPRQAVRSVRMIQRSTSRAYCRVLVVAVAAAAREELVVGTPDADSEPRR